MTEQLAIAIAEPHTLQPSYNIAPTQETYIVDAVAHARRLRVVRWGLVPSWSRDTTGAARLINARSESITEKPSFKAAFAKRRCIIPMDGWYEWQGAGKQPWYMSMRDGRLATVAGIYEHWRPANADPANPASWVHTNAVITTSPSADVAHVHDRMPVLIAHEDIDAWLDPETPLHEVQHLLHPAPAGLVQAWRVARLVSQVRNNGAQLIEPLDPAAAAPSVEQPGLWE